MLNTNPMNVPAPVFGLSDLGLCILQRAEHTPFMEELVITLDDAEQIAKACDVSFNDVVEYGLKLEVLVVV